MSGVQTTGNNTGTIGDQSLRGAERRSKDLLPRVSRTFALGIKILPRPLEAAVRVGYLLCRIADTIEDDLGLGYGKKAELLDSFLCCFDDSHAAQVFGGVSDCLRTELHYHELVSDTADIFSLYRTLPQPTQTILRRCVTDMVRGMRRFILAHPGGIRIASIEELRLYSYYVAGTVGQMLTELWREHSPAIGEQTFARLVANAEAFGEGLQLINILKDIAWDAVHENAIYVPSSLLTDHGTDHDHLLDDGCRTGNRNALEPLITLADEDLVRALRYVQDIPVSAARIRYFCTLPVMFAVATLREIRATDSLVQRDGKVTISRREVSAIVAAAAVLANSNGTLKWLARRIRMKPLTI